MCFGEGQMAPKLGGGSKKSTLYKKIGLEISMNRRQKKKNGQSASEKGQKSV